MIYINQLARIRFQRKLAGGLSHKILLHFQHIYNQKQIIAPATITWITTTPRTEIFLIHDSGMPLLGVHSLASQPYILGDIGKPTVLC